MTNTQTPHPILHPAGGKKASGYSNGLLTQGRTVWVGGQVGWNGDQVFEAKDLAGQIRQALENIVAILAEAGAGPEHIVRFTWYVVDKQEYLANLKGVGESYRAVIGKHFPAMTMVQVADLIEDDARVEIEATAVIPD